MTTCCTKVVCVCVSYYCEEYMFNICSYSFSPVCPPKCTEKWRIGWNRVIHDLSNLAFHFSSPHTIPPHPCLSYDDYNCFIDGASRCTTNGSEKDAFSEQLECLVASVIPHDQLLILADLNASSGTDRTGFKRVIGNCGSGDVNDNCLFMISLCSSHNLSIMGSCTDSSGSWMMLIPIKNWITFYLEVVQLSNRIGLLKMLKLSQTLITN